MLSVILCLWVVVVVGTALECSEPVFADGFNAIGGYSAEALELRVCCNETHLNITILPPRPFEDIVEKATFSFECYDDELNNVTHSGGEDEFNPRVPYSCTYNVKPVCNVTLSYTDRNNSPEDQISANCALPVSAQTMPAHTTPGQATQIVQTTQGQTMQVQTTPAHTTQSQAMQMTQGQTTQVQATSVHTTPGKATQAVHIQPTPTPLAPVQTAETPSTSPPEVYPTSSVQATLPLTDGKGQVIGIQVMTLVVFATLGAVFCLCGVMAAVIYKWSHLRRSRSRKIVRDYPHIDTAEDIFADFDPELDKFPGSLSMDSFTTLIDPLEEYPMSNCKMEYDSTRKCEQRIDKNLYSLKKCSSSGSYLNICEDCELTSNKSQVCECSNLQDFVTSQTGKDSIATQSDQISELEISADMEESKLKESEAVIRIETDNSSKCSFTVIEGSTTRHGSPESGELAVDQRELTGSRTDLSIPHIDNDSGIECGFPNS